MKSFKAVLLFLFLFQGVACQTPTQVSEQDLEQEQRVFSKVDGGSKLDLQRAVIIDVRSRFDFEMSRLPRSFFAEASDWDLRSYSGNSLKRKVKQLQRLLSLNGVDPLVQVVLLGRGLEGQGEEFLLAQTLLALGIERVRMMTVKQVKKAMVAKDLPPLENTPRWEQPLKDSIFCDASGGSEPSTKSADIVIDAPSSAKRSQASEYFTSDLELKKRLWPKKFRLKIVSPQSYWAHGLSLYLKRQGRQVCIL